MLNLYELNIFIHAAETENFSEAARRLRLTQPAISLNIKSLERQLGIDLFQNVGRNVVLTDAGRSLLPMAHELVTLASQIEESVCALRGQVVGQLNIGCAATAGRYILPTIIGRFRQLYPEVRISVTNADAQSLPQRLLDGRIHLGLTCVAEKHPDMEYHELMNDELVLIVSPQHPWAKTGGVSLRDLTTQELILRQPGAGSRQILLEALSKQGIHHDDLTVSLELGSCEEVELAVESGLGIALVSRLAAARPLALGRVVAVPIPDTDLRHPVYLARNRRGASSCAQLRFFDLLNSPDLVQALPTAARP